MTTKPAARDERELFESAYLKEYFYPAERCSLVPEKYRTEHADIAWRAWQARAALAESELAEVREQLRIREEERAEQWRLRRDAEGDLITSHAVVSELRAELERVKNPKPSPICTDDPEFITPSNAATEVEG